MSWTTVLAQNILSPDQQEQAVLTACAQLERLPLMTRRDRLALDAEARSALTSALSRLGLFADAILQGALLQQVVARVGGMGFLNELLPAPNYDPGLTEIALNPDGSLWVQRKGAQDFERLETRPGVQEVWRAVEALLAPMGRALTEAAPSVDAKLFRIEGVGGARIKILHPNIAPGKGYPAINVRLFEPYPVRPEKLVEWNVAPAAVIRSLIEHVGRRLRLLVIGGTGTGKTTLLSALCNGIPRTARIVKVEDPEEIWLDHPNVVTIEARPQQVGSDVPPLTLTDGVRDAMRMAPRWLIVGEVRDGHAASALFNAQMSAHAGLSTYHAESPEDAVFRLALQMFHDEQVKMDAAKALFARAVDLVVQVEWQDERRLLTGVWEVDGLRGGEVRFNPLYTPGDVEMRPSSHARR